MIQLRSMLMFQAVIATPFLLISLLLFRAKPKTPPSKAAVTKKLPFKDSLRQLVHDKNYLIFCLSSGLLWGSFLVAGMVIQPIVEPFGYTPNDVGAYGAIITFCGLAGSLYFGGHVGKTKSFKKTIIRLTSFATLMLFLAFPLAQTGNEIALGAGLAIYGFLMLPFIPIALEYVCELTFPVAEATSAGLMITCAQVFGAGMGIVVDLILGEKNKKNSVIGLGVLIILASLGVFGQIMTNQDLKRDRAEKQTASVYVEDPEPDIAEICG